MSCNPSLEKVSWTINKNDIENILLKKSKYSKYGLLFEDREYAGKIHFEDYSCKNDICNKSSNNINISKGSKDSVYTPLSVVNFHTHPLSCYLDNETIWGWPSGEDLKECISFSKKGNLTHIIFTVEGTYIIEVNRDCKITSNVAKCIEELFKNTHKYRLYYNPDETGYDLHSEFDKLYLKPIQLNKEKNILYSWLSLVNNLTLDKLKILCNNFKIKLNTENISNNNCKFYSIKLVENKTLQFEDSSDIKKFRKLNNVTICMKCDIKYKAPFISSKCRLN